MKYRTAVPDDYKSIWKLICEVRWDKHLGDEERFCKILDNSDRTVVALEGSRVVGFARAICDDVSVGYITMVTVAHDKRGNGIGSRMVKTLIGNDPNIKWVITNTSSSLEFWQKHGFRVSKNVMIKRRAIGRSYHKDTSPSPTRKTLRKYIRNLIMKVYRFI